MFAYAMARGAQRGWLPPEFLGHARRATRGVLNHQVDLLPGNRMDIRGTVRVGSLGGDGGFYDYYVGVPVGDERPEVDRRVHVPEHGAERDRQSRGETVGSRQFSYFNCASISFEPT